jgi:2-oxoisovalerate dehydrogenase E1 component
LKLGQIAVNAYSKTLPEELASNPDITPGSCIRIFRDMALVREFETMLDQVKKLGAYEGIPCQHAGPAHLSLGQEGAAVGEAFHLKVRDHIYGSHRSHGEIIAKGLRAILELKGTSLRAIMEGYFGGAALRVIEKHDPDWSLLTIAGKGKSRNAAFASDEEEEQGVDFLLYGLLAEIVGRENGFNKGMGGSMHAFFCPFGIFPNNAIVGGSADIAPGAALFPLGRLRIKARHAPQPSEQGPIIAAADAVAIDQLFGGHAGLQGKPAPHQTAVQADGPPQAAAIGPALQRQGQGQQHQAE